MDAELTPNGSESVALLRQMIPLFQALGDTARQEIIVVLACHKRLSVGELASYTTLSRPAVSHHLRILKDAGLLSETREGVKRYYQPTFSAAIYQLERMVQAIHTTKELR